MPTIEIDVPAGRPHKSIERVCEDHDVTHLELLLAGVDAVATPDRTPPKSQSQPKHLDAGDHDCEGEGCDAMSTVRVNLPQERERLRYFCADCFERFAYDYNPDSAEA